eukprot:203197-Prymnesium_polylepis.1
MAYFVVKRGVATRLFSSRSHRRVLGHDPLSCNGELSTLRHLYTKDFLENELPGLITAFESGELHGRIGEMPLLHQDGRELWFEWRVTADATDNDRLLVIWRDISERKERLRIEAAANAEKERAWAEKEAANAEKERAWAEKEAAIVEKER